ncbi:MAG: dTDP-4-dehydrorhamnose reductase [Chitinophagaceae bacterium]|nr:dTDP-4-dehydrorhamnose reductase [Chitinophagaceae bacterium]
MLKPLILVTGKDGQLGFELQQIQKNYSSQFDFLFVGRKELDLSVPETIASFIEKHQPKYLINAAAYTAVDKAETEAELAFTINASSPSEMAKVCKEINCHFIHISTDYVFDGKKKSPYMPSDQTNPINIYGASKAKGEELILEHNPQSIVIRTSWVYSSHGKNFVKTMMSLMSERDEINVVNDQIGNPTYAADLAEAILQIVSKLNNSNLIHSSIYHYSNTGNISWFQFAEEIQKLSSHKCRVNPIASVSFPTPAKRSSYSVLDCSAIQKDFGVEIKNWKSSLATMLNNLESNPK